MLVWPMKSANSYLEVSQLREWLPTVIELAAVRLGLEMDQSVGSHVPALREVLPADVAMVRALASMTALVSPEVTHLGELLIADIARLRGQLCFMSVGSHTYGLYPVCRRL
jgi:hypothetical protein